MILSEMLWPQVCQWLPQVEEYVQEIAFDGNLVCQISDYVRTLVIIINVYYIVLFLKEQSECSIQQQSQGGLRCEVCFSLSSSDLSIAHI